MAKSIDRNLLAKILYVMSSFHGSVYSLSSVPNGTTSNPFKKFGLIKYWPLQDPMMLKFV